MVTPQCPSRQSVGCEAVPGPCLGTGWGLSCRAPEASHGLVTGQAQALKELWTSSPSPPLELWSPCLAVQGRLSNWSKWGICHSGDSFNQLQSLCSSFRNWSGLDQLSILRKWPEVRDNLHRYGAYTSGPLLWLGPFSKKGNCCELGTHMIGNCYSTYSCRS